VHNRKQFEQTSHYTKSFRAYNVSSKRHSIQRRQRLAYLTLSEQPVLYTQTPIKHVISFTLITYFVTYCNVYLADDAVNMSWSALQRCDSSLETCCRDL